MHGTTLLSAPPAAPPRRRVPPWAGPVAGAAILVVLLRQLGTGPVLDGLRRLDAGSVAAALALGAVGTVCVAWRWSVIARGLGLRLPLPTAVADCYRSVFLNSTLPGGVLGDVHRAVRHGRDAGDVGRGVRAVVWERTAGQVVQLGMALVVLATVPSPVRAAVPWVAGAVVAVLVGAVLLCRADRLAAVLRTVRGDVRDVLLAPGVRSRVVLASAVAVGCHVGTFLVAARAAGVEARLALVPLAFLALLAMSVPANLGGFGPREGVTAWAFAAAGLGAATGVTTAILYGVLALLASVPGAAVLLVRRRRP